MIHVILTWRALTGYIKSMRAFKRCTVCPRGVGNKAFTLIELMIVVAIISILAAIAIPKFADLIRKSNEGSSKANLGAIRSSLYIYYGDLEGQYPKDPTILTFNAKYLAAWPPAKNPNYDPDST